MAGFFEHLERWNLQSRVRRLEQRGVGGAPAPQGPSTAQLKERLAEQEAQIEMLRAIAGVLATSIRIRAIDGRLRFASSSASAEVQTQPASG